MSIHFTRKIVVGFILIIASVVFSLLIIEATCYFLNRSPWSERFKGPQSGGGYLPIPSAPHHFEVPSSGSLLPKHIRSSAGFAGSALVDSDMKFPEGYLFLDENALARPWPSGSRSAMESKELGLALPAHGFPPKDIDFQRSCKDTVSPFVWEGEKSDSCIMPRVSHSILKEKVSKKKIYDVHYSIDEFGRRWTPQKDFRTQTRHLLFVGDSFVFGEGLDDDETLPAQVAKLDNSFHVYNLGFHGYSPSSLWLRARTTGFMDHIQESKGVAVYLFIDPHVSRFVGAMSITSNWGGALPDVEIDDEEIPRIRGSFVSGRPFWTWLYAQIWKTETRRYFNFDLPILGTSSNIHRFSLMIGALKKIYREKTGSENFYVVFFPGASMSRNIIPELENMKISYLDYSALDLQAVSAEPTSIPMDGHPSKKANEILAALIYQDLLQKKFHADSH